MEKVWHHHPGKCPWYFAAFLASSFAITDQWVSVKLICQLSGYLLTQDNGGEHFHSWTGPFLESTEISTDLTLMCFS